MTKTEIESGRNTIKQYVDLILKAMYESANIAKFIFLLRGILLEFRKKNRLTYIAN